MGLDLADQGQQARGGRVEVRGQPGDLVAEAVQRRDARVSGSQHGQRGDRHGEASFG
ncbi:MAG: hypothetical protein ACREK9_01605 [Candidatus Rokuibacteriota bacterium]